jgi:hypothetical protein
MGMQKTVSFANASRPTWKNVHEGFQRRGIAVPIRMIDGMPAFPDELPEETWKELRLGFPAGMVTVRREGSTWTCVIWGNSDPELVKAMELCCEVIADAS